MDTTAANHQEDRLASYETVLGFADQTLVVCYSSEQCYTLSDLNHKIAEIYFQVHGHQAQRWALCVEDNFLFAAAFFALLYAGKTPVILGHTRVSLVNEQRILYDTILSDEAQQFTASVYLVDTVIRPQNANQIYAHTIAQGTMVLFTSGSTSAPKELVKPIDLLQRETHVLMQQWGAVFAGSKVVATVSALHQYGLTFVILLALTLRLPFHQKKIAFQEEFGNLQSGDYVLISSPAFLKRLDAALIPQVRFKAIFSAGGALSFEDATTSETILGVRPTEIYGSSETGVIAWRQQYANSSDFKAFPQIVISQYPDQSIALDSPLMLAGDFRLNDIIEPTPTGFYLKNRLDKVIKIGEKRISLSDLEARISKFDNIDKAIVLPLEEKRRTILGVVMVLNDKEIDSAVFFREIRRELTKFVEPVAIPRRFRVVETLPENSQGKFSYHDLKALFE